MMFAQLSVENISYLDNKYFHINLDMDFWIPKVR